MPAPAGGRASGRRAQRASGCHEKFGSAMPPLGHGEPRRAPSEGSARRPPTPSRSGRSTEAESRRVAHQDIPATTRPAPARDWLSSSPSRGRSPAILLGARRRRTWVRQSVPRRRGPVAWISAGAAAPLAEVRPAVELRYAPERSRRPCPTARGPNASKPGCFGPIAQGAAEVVHNQRHRHGRGWSFSASCGGGGCRSASASPDRRHAAPTLELGRGRRIDDDGGLQGWPHARIRHGASRQLRAVAARQSRRRRGPVRAELAHAVGVARLSVP